MWEIEVTDEFVDWWNGLTDHQQESVTDRVDLLAERGPTSAGRLSIASRPPGTTTGRNFGRVKAARCGCCSCSRRQVILLVGGDKTGNWNAWYERAAPLADDLYDAYLAELHDEGLI